jgi:hypothetical protein
MLACFFGFPSHALTMKTLAYAGIVIASHVRNLTLTPMMFVDFLGYLLSPHKFGIASLVHKICPRRGLSSAMESLYIDVRKVTLLRLYHADTVSRQVAQLVEVLCYKFSP